MQNQLTVFYVLFLVEVVNSLSIEQGCSALDTMNLIALLY